MAEELQKQEPQPTEVGPEKPEQKEVMIPKTRFDEVNEKNKELAAQLAEYEAAKAEQAAAAEQQALELKKEQGKFEELYADALKQIETLSQVKERATQLESTIDGMVKAKLAQVPEEMIDLIPTNLGAEKTLEWITKAESKGLFATPQAKEIGKPSNHSVEPPKVDKAKLSPLDKILVGLGGK